MERQGDRIYFNLNDHRRVDDLQDGMDVRGVPALYKSITESQEEIRAEIYGFKRDHDEAKAGYERCRVLDAFLVELGTIAPDELAYALTADELAKIPDAPPSKDF
jgi:hypothetical protein